MGSIDLPRRSLGRTGLRVSPLGLAGSYGIGPDAVEGAFHDLSINYFFVSPRMKGLLEGLRRLVRAGHREEIVIACGANIPIGALLHRQWDATARAVGTDHVDVFHLFYVQSRWFVGGRTWPAMLALKRDGKARALSISTHNRPLAAALARELGLDALMIRYNAAHRGAEEEIFSALGADRPGIVSYTATRWGQLLKRADGQGPLTAPECYRFALSHPAVDVVLSGARAFEEIAENARGVLAGPLDPVRLEEVRRFGDLVRARAAGRFSFR